jgi:manganese-dependent inorganic pyrophosphatase
MDGQIYVIGHVNPDTDSIASAIGLSWYLRATNNLSTVPARAGSINPQTAWLLNYLNMEVPILITDASPRFESVLNKIEASLPDKLLSEAKIFARKNSVIVPIINPDGSPLGLVTSDSFINLMIRRIGDKSDKSTTLQDILNLPCVQAIDVNISKFKISARIKDYMNKILKDEENVFLVVDDKNKYMGITFKKDLINPPRVKLILVDHNEKSQSIPSLDEAEIIEILDHHRLANPPTNSPISFTVEPVGSTSTLVAERIINAKIKIPYNIAALILAGIISDTLNLRSPTTTSRDAQAIQNLSEFAFIEGTILEKENPQRFAEKLLTAGAGLRTRPIMEIVSGDIKQYFEGGYKFAIAQAEVNNLVELNDYINSIKDALKKIRQSKGLDFTGLMVTDVVRGSSKIIFDNLPPILEELPFQKENDDTWLAKDLVSRKKQLIPVLLSLIKG